MASLFTGVVEGEAEAIYKTVLETHKTKHTKEYIFDKVSKGIICRNTTQTPIFENGALKYLFYTANEVDEIVLNNQSIEHQRRIIQQQKEQLDQQTTQLVSIIENLSDGVMIIDNSGKVILANSEAKKLFYEMDEIIDLGDDVRNTKLFDMEKYIYATTYNSKQYVLYDSHGEKIGLEGIPNIRVRNGEKFKNMRISAELPNRTLQLEVSGTPIYNNEGVFNLGIICSRDITDYFNHVETIKNQYEFLNRMIDTFNVPVVRISCPDLKIKDINIKALSTINLLRPDLKSIDQLKNIMVENLFEDHKTNEYYKCVSEVLKEKKVKYLNKRNHLLNGENIYWNLIFEPMLDANGEIQEILVLIIDVTKEIKSNMVMEETLKLQEEYFANISHELKTPLNVIFASAQLINVYCKNDTLDEKKESITKYINSIKQNSYRLSKLINNIVDLSKIEAGYFELNLSNNNIVEIVEEIVMSVTGITESEDIHIIFDTDTEDKIIACDAERIERVVLNLISNAIKFSDEGDEIFIDIKDKDEYVEVSIKDNGIGIEEENLEMIFDRFKQVDKSLSRNAEGTGIGLSIVKSIVELHGGHIYVESEFGKGSKFTFILPARRVLNESMLYSNKMKNENEMIQVELSDVRP